MRLKKALFAIAATVLASVAVAGCGQSGSKSTNSNQDDTKTITIWSGSTGPDGKRIKKTITDYNKKNPKYKVKVVLMDGAALSKKIVTAGKSGEGMPDLVMAASETVAQYASQGLIRNVDKYIKGTEVNADNYVKASWDTGEVKGKHYGVPSDLGTWIMFYNKDLVAKYAPDAMKDGVVTYDEIQAAGAKAKADGVYAISNDWTMQNWSNMYMQQGGDFNQSGKLNVNNSKSIKAMNLYKTMYKNGIMVPQAQNAMKLFSNNKLLFMPEGTWMIGQLNETKVNWGATFTAQMNADHIVNGTGAGQFVVMKKNKTQSDAKMKGIVKFYEYLQTNQLEWLKSGVNSPAIKMQNNAEYKKMPQYFLISSKKAQNALKVVTKEGVSYANDEVDARGWDMITGKANIKDTFNTIQQTVDQKLGQ